MCGTPEILMNMCGTPEILMKNVRYCNNGNSNETCAVQLKSLTHVCAILEKTSQSGPHFRDPCKSWKKLHKMSPIPGTPDNTWKSCEKPPHKKSSIPGTPGNPGKNLTILRICLRCWLVAFRQAVQIAPAGAKNVRGNWNPNEKCAGQLESY